MLIILSLLLGGSVGTLTSFYGLDHDWSLFKTSAVAVSISVLLDIPIFLLAHYAQS
jgi:hypothetical protein